GGPGVAAEEYVAERIEGHCRAVVEAAAAEISEKRQRVSSRHEFGHESVLGSAGMALHGARRHRQIGRGGIAEYYGAAAAIPCYRVPDVHSRSPQIGAVKERRARRVELGDEGVARAAEPRLQRRNQREIGGRSLSREVDVLCCIEGKPERTVVSRPSQIG